MMLRSMKHLKVRPWTLWDRRTSNRAVEPPRFNEINIQLLPESLHKQIFDRGKQALSLDIQSGESSGAISTPQTNSQSQPSKPEEGASPTQLVKTLNSSQFYKVKKHLQEHKLWDIQKPPTDNIHLDLPALKGENIQDHFYNLGQQQVEPYVRVADLLCRSKLPTKPKKWAYKPGWVRYDGNKVTPVAYPPDDVLVFDVETLVTEGNYPVMATAMSNTHWYSWCSDYLVLEKFRWSQGLQLEDLVPMETASGGRRDIPGQPRLIIGHNVAFDRSYIKEQYHIQKSRLRFLDTMSMHIAVCGLTNFQRVLYKAESKESSQKIVLEYRERQKQRGAIRVDDWKEVSAMNNLRDVHHLHVGSKPIDKDPRNIFVEGSMEDVRENFQDLMRYCSCDVDATTEVFRVLWPQFQERFPHPVSLAGTLEMCTGYLPVNENWQRYINQANNVFQDMVTESKQLLMKLASDACQLLENERYKDDPWLYDLDWSVKPFKVKKQKPLTKKQLKERAERGEEAEEWTVDDCLTAQDRHHKTGNYMAGYPKWYRELCKRLEDEDWTPGPCGISAQTRVTPKLLRLKWDGYPVHYDEKYGWGYLVPGRGDNLCEPGEQDSDLNRSYPYEKMCEMFNFNTTAVTSADPENDLADATLDEEAFSGNHDNMSMADVSDMSDEKFESMMQRVMSGVNDAGRDSFRYLNELRDARMAGKKKRVLKTKVLIPDHVGDGPHNSVNIPGCWFFKIPHKDGKENRVGNPLSKPYLNQLEDGTLSAHSTHGADMVLKLHKACTYWKNNQKRIESQMSVMLPEEDLPQEIKQNRLGAITSEFLGHDYKRLAAFPLESAVEGESGSYREGSHIGAIVPRIIPSGTITRRGVENTWLTASNAYTDRIGSELKAMIQSPPGYCFVGADVDSQELWIGALLGDAQFANSHGCTALGWMTLQGNKKDGTDLHSRVAQTVNISRDHAKVFNYGRIYGAGQMFAEKLLLQFNHRMSQKEAKEKARLMFSTTKGKRNRQNGKWWSGSESAMFNQLEAIARQDCPCTPVLKCRISKALEPEYVNEDFMTSRINWVVQSSAVDYLHLMLVSMRWLLEEYNINGRFSISIHDEVRYLVAETDRYEAALALDITNLLTRAMFAHSLGMNDLPLSVAFFQAVDIDRCLRKEVDMDCVTPSNPHGLEAAYHIPEGEALDIQQILEKTGGDLRPQQNKDTQCTDNISSCLNSEDSKYESNNGIMYEPNIQVSTG